MNLLNSIVVITKRPMQCDSFICGTAFETAHLVSRQETASLLVASLPDDGRRASPERSADKN